MVNDINTLNGSLQALGEKMASNLTTMGVPSTYDEGLNTLADKILQVAPKKLDHLNVELIAGSQILSYADEQQTPDSQYATVRFTAYADVGETETIPNLSLDFQVGTGTVTQVVTDSDGRYEYTYHSIGAGDVEISASKTVEGSLVSKIYNIEDCYDYDLTTYTSTATSPIQVPNNDFELTYKSILKTSTAHNTNLNIYGVLDDNSTQIISVIGLAKRTGKDGFHTSFVVNGVWEEYWHSSPVTVNSEYLVKYIYNNGQHSLYVDGDLLITTSKIMKNMHNVSVGVSQSEYIKELKIKPL